MKKIKSNNGKAAKVLAAAISSVGFVTPVMFSDIAEAAETMNYSIGGQNISLTGTSTATDSYSIAVGINAIASGRSSVALGKDAKASDSYSVALGLNATASDTYSVALGQNATASARSSYAIGDCVTANGKFSGALGYQSLTEGHSSFAVGFYAHAAGEASVAFGFGKYKSNGAGGYMADTDYGALGDYSFVAGYAGIAKGEASVSIGYESKAYGKGSVALGNSTAGVSTTDATTDTYAFAAGQSTASGVYSTATGTSTASGNYSVAMGNGSVASGVNSTALSGGTASAENAIALGGTASHANSLALGSGATTSAANQVSVGNGTTNRKIVNMADGTVSSTSKEAVNGSQLYSATTLTSAGNYYAANAGVTTAVAAVDAQIGKIGTDGSYVKQANTVSANLSALDTKIGALSSDGNYITKDGTVSANLSALDTQVKTNATNIGTNADAITKLNADKTTTGSVDYKIDQALTGGSYDINGKSVKVNNVTYINSDGINANDKKVINVADGTVSSTSKDAVNGSQLYSATTMSSAGNYYAKDDKVTTAVAAVDTAMGKLNSDGNYITTSKNVYENMGLLDSQVKTNATNIGTNADAIAKLNAGKTTSGSVDYKIDQALTAGTSDIKAASYKVGDKTYINSDGLNANDKKVINVADGDVSSTSKDAVNGSQLYGATTMSSAGNYYAANDKVTTAVAAVDSKIGKIGTDGSYVKQANTVSANLSALDTKIGALSSDGNYITQAGSVSANLSALDTKAKANADAITLLNANDSTAGSVDYKIKQAVTAGVTAGNFFEKDGTGSDIKLKTTGKISNVADGTVSSTSKDAVNGSQLYGATTMSSAGNYYAANDKVTAAVAAVDTKIGKLSTDGNYITKAGTVSANLSALDTRAKTNADAITKLNGSSTTTGSVDYKIDQALTGGSYDINGKSVKVNNVTYINSDGINANDNKVINVADGTVSSTSTDAVNGKQLYGATTMSSDGNYYDTDDKVTTAVENIDKNIGKLSASGNYITKEGTVSANLSALDTRAKTNTDAITLLNGDSTKTGSVDYKIAQAMAGGSSDINGKSVKVNNVTYIDSDGINANNKKVINVADGTVSSTSTDAVNGKQLYGATTMDSTGNYYETNDKVTTAIKNVDEKMGKLSADGNYIKKADSVSANLSALDTKAKANADAIDTLNGDKAKIGSVDYKIDQALTAGTSDIKATSYKVGDKTYISSDGLNANDKKIINVADGTEAGDAVNLGQLNAATTMTDDGNYYETNDKVTTAVKNIDNKIGKLADDGTYIKKADSVSTNLSALDSQAKTNADNIATNATNIATNAANIADNANAIAILNGDAGTAGSVDYKIANAVLAGVDMGSDNGNYYVAHDNVVTAVKKVDAQVKVNENAITNAYIGSGNDVTGATNYSVLGHNNTITGDKSVAVGYGHTVKGNGSGAFGDPSTVVGDGSYAYGNDNTVYGDGSYVMGNNNNIGASGSPVNNTFIFGSNVTTSAANSVILGYGSTATEDNVVSVGSSGAERKIVNVADGTIASGSHDAINGGQLYDKLGDLTGGTYTTISASNNVSQNLAALDAALASGSLTAGDSAFEVDATTNDAKLKNKGKLTNIAAGTSASDAVNYGQLSELANNMDRQFSKVNEDIGRSGAASAALASLHPQMMRKGESQVMAGMGRYHGKSGAAVGLAWQPHERVMLSGGFADAAGEMMFNVGASYKFGQHSYTPEELAELYEGGPGVPLYVAELNSVLESKENKINIIKADYAMLKADNAAMKEKLDRLEGILAKILASAKK